MQKNNKGFIETLLTIITLIVLGVVAFYTIFSIKIPVGYVGIKVNMYGDDKGVSVYTLKTGRNYYNPISSDVFRYPTFIQQKEYSDVSFQDTDGLVITSNIGMDYKFSDNKIGKIFEEYRADADKITSEYMATWLKSSVNKSSSKFKVDELYGAKKEEFRLLVLENIKKDFDSKGIIVNNVYFVGQMKLPSAVIGRINAKIEATQTAMQKENELRAVEAEAQKQIAQSKGEAEAKIAKSNGIAQSTLIEAKAEAEAIRIKSQAITAQGGAEYVELKKIEQWNGVLPQITGANTMISVPFNK